MNNYSTAESDSLTFTERFGVWKPVPNFNLVLTLAARELKVYLVLVGHINVKGRADSLVWPKQATIAKESGYSREEVNRAIKVLVAKGFITSQWRYAGGVKRGNQYEILHIEKPVPTHEEQFGLGEEKLPY